MIRGMAARIASLACACPGSVQAARAARQRGANAQQLTTVYGRCPARRMASGIIAVPSQRCRQQNSRSICTSRVLCQSESGMSDMYAQKASSAMHPLFQGMLRGILSRYWERSRTALLAAGFLSELCDEPQTQIYFDHLAFRTFGEEGVNIEAFASCFTDFGYTPQDELDFPEKHVRARWYKPLSYELGLPRIFISELKMDALSREGALLVSERVKAVRDLAHNYTVLAAAGHILPWTPPLLEGYQALAQESEYAAWTLTNSFALNHAAVAVHRVKGLRGDLATVVSEMKSRGLDMNDVGGVVKVSPDGLLQQAATVADHVKFRFMNGELRDVPGPYIEFAERDVLPEFVHLPPDRIREDHRRDGFEASNADKVFDSTRLAMEGRKPVEVERS